MDTLKLIEKIKKQLEEITNMNELNDLRVVYMGKKGIITELQASIKDVANEEKKEYGMKVNEIKNLFLSLYEEKKNYFEELELNKKLEQERIDITLEGRNMQSGSIHPLTRIKQELEDLFISMGYIACEGPEVEDDLHCFEMLNLPKNHPARDTQDTFYISDELLLRTQTSAMQARFMESLKEKKPFRIIVPGKTYRRDDDDATHSHQFMQMEGLVVGEDISLADLKGTLEAFAKKMFGKNQKVRFRPSYFPFTEPSYEVDISCTKCGGKGCNACGFDSKKYQGFAFGIGIERVAMLKYGINNIRDFYTNDLRFISNFTRMDIDMDMESNIEGGKKDETK